MFSEQLLTQHSQGDTSSLGAEAEVPTPTLDGKYWPAVSLSTLGKDHDKDEEEDKNALQLKRKQPVSNTYYLQI